MPGAPRCREGGAGCWVRRALRPVTGPAGLGGVRPVSVPVLLPPTLYCRGDMGLFRAVARVNAGSFGRPQATATART